MKKFTLLFAALLFLQMPAQKRDSTYHSNVPLKFRVQGLYAPGAMVVGGTALMLTEKRATHAEYGKTPLIGKYFENYAQYAPFAANVAFELSGMNSRTDPANRLAISTKTAVLNLGTSYLFRKLLKKPAPDGSTKYAFPSGPTTTAFAGATTLSIEYGQNYPWVPYAAYAVAGGVGALRLAHNKNEWSGVLFGAGLGILSSKVAYWTHKYRWRAKRDGKLTTGVELIPRK